MTKIIKDKLVNNNITNGGCMKEKIFTQGITFFVTGDMYNELKAISDGQHVALSETVREMLKASINDLKETATTNSKRRSSWITQ